MSFSAENAPISRDLFGTEVYSLDPQRTSSHSQWTDENGKILKWPEQQRLNRIEREHYTTTIPACPVESAFRHRGWLLDRRRVRACMVRTGVPPARLAKFDACGAAAIVEVAEDGSAVRLKAAYCGDRWCVPCCRARSRRVVQDLTRLSANEALAFVTLTARPASESLDLCLRHVLGSFTRLRNSKWWRDTIRGGCATVEITRGAAGDHWHVHVHCLLTGKFIRPSLLRAAWKLASRGSHVVDVRPVDGRGRAVEYVAKYAAKGWARELLNDDDRADEAMVTLKGKRLLMTFGTWFNANIGEGSVDNRVYKVVGRLSDIARAAVREEPWAVGLMQALKVKATAENGLVVFVKHAEKS